VSLLISAQLVVGRADQPTIQDKSMLRSNRQTEPGYCPRRGFVLLAALCLLLPTGALAQEQSRESAALDNTASAWSFQLAYQAMPDYRQDTLASGEVRPEGNKAYTQFRIVAPIKIAGVSVLPRLTARVSENKDGEWGFSPTDLFALILPFDWGTGRAGLGPDIVIPGSSKVGSSEWSYGLAGAVI